MHPHAHVDLDASLLHALMAGIGVAAIAGILGCFVVWRRMAYFGDALSHSALLGIALGMASGAGINLSILAVGVVFALCLLWLQHYQHSALGTDTLLGILAHAGLAIGMVVASLLGVEIDLHSYLFGDILAITTTQLYWIYAGGSVAIALLIMHWQPLVLMSIHRDLATVEHKNIFISQAIFMCLMALVVAISMRVVGILLITAMLIIPPATARQLASTPESMAIMACSLGALAMLIGIPASMTLDIPSGPAIVSIFTILFILVVTLNALRRK
jgi:zinc transport system permease protein